MNVNDIPAVVLAIIFTAATIHLAVEGFLGVRRWFEGRKNRTLTTYALPNSDGTFTDITRADRDALLAQGWHEIEVAFDETTPLFDQTVCDQYEREFGGGAA